MRHAVSKTEERNGAFIHLSIAEGRDVKMEDIYMHTYGDIQRKYDVMLKLRLCLP